jgi:hypothetical protein
MCPVRACAARLDTTAHGIHAIALPAWRHFISDCCLAMKFIESRIFMQRFIRGSVGEI